MKWSFCRLSYLCILLALPLAASTIRIFVPNSGGSTIDIIDPTTDKVVQKIEGITEPHGVVFSPDGSRAYITSESEPNLFAVETKTGKIIKKVPLSDNANLPAIAKDGSRVFVCIRGGEGAVDIVDTSSLEKVKTLPMKAPMHDCFRTPDGKYVVAGSVEGKFAVAIDLRTEQPVWEIPFDRGVETMTIEGGRDGGSTRRIFVNLEGFRGFAVVDFPTHKEVARIKFPDKPTGFVGIQNSHGGAISPDGKMLWANSSAANGVFVYSLPELKLLRFIPTPVKAPAAAGRPALGGHPAWLTFTPDGTKAYVCNSHANVVSAIDAITLKEVARIPVDGEEPNRCTTLVMP